MLARGLGIARMPARYARPEHGLVEILAKDAPPPRHLFAVYPGARNVSSALRALLDVLADRFELEPWS